MEDYDYIVVGAGFFGATVAERLAAASKKVLIIDRRNHVAGNAYSFRDQETGIEIHKYGSHIFHTEKDEVWNYITKFGEFNDYIHTVHTRHNEKLYPMPINLDTINILYDTDMDAGEAEDFIKEEAAKEHIESPQNFEEKGLSLVGKKLYEAFLKNYTEKQWSTSATNISADILRRIPVRFDHNNKYFASAKHQGIPKEGYGKLVEQMLQNKNIDIKLETEFKTILQLIPKTTPIIFCGQIDELMDYELGVLPYRSLRFEEEKTNNTLGEAVINEADAEVPYTRTHDYKYYQIHEPEIIKQDACIICREYPADFQKGGEAYYPINNDENEALYNQYTDKLKEKYPNIILGGRLGAYKYWDMDITIYNALEMAKQILG